MEWFCPSHAETHASGFLGAAEDTLVYNSTRQTQWRIEFWRGPHFAPMDAIRCFYMSKQTGLWVRARAKHCVGPKVQAFIKEASDFFVSIHNPT